MGVRGVVLDLRYGQQKERIFFRKRRIKRRARNRRSGMDENKGITQAQERTDGRI